MSITFNRKDLTAATAIAANHVERNALVPILSCVNLVVKDGAASLTGSNHETTVTIQIDANGDDDLLSLNGEAFRGFCAKASGEKINIRRDGGKVVLTGGGSRISIPLEAQEYPEFAPVDPAAEFPLPCVDLIRAFNRVAYAADASDPREVCKGIMISADGADISIAAMDGRKASRETLTASASFDGLSIPVASALSVAKILPKSGDVEVSLSDRYVSFSWPGGSFTTRVIEGGYFAKVSTVCDDKSGGTAAGATPTTFAADAMRTALDRCMLADFSKVGRAVKFERREGTLTLEGRGRERVVSDEIPAEFEGDFVPLGLDPRFLSAMLATFDGEVTMTSAGPSAPVLFSSPAQPTRSAVIYPVRV